MAGPSLFINTMLTEIKAAIRAGRQQLEAAGAAGLVTNVARNAESSPGALSATGGLQAPNMLFGLPGGSDMIVKIGLCEPPAALDVLDWSEQRRFVTS